MKVAVGLISISLCIVLGVFAFLLFASRNRTDTVTNKVIRIFVALLLAILAWTILNFLAGYVYWPEYSTLLNRVVFAISIIMFGLLGWFVCSSNRVRLPKSFRIVSFVTIAALALFSLTSCVVEGTYYSDELVIIKFGVGSSIYFLGLLTMMIFVISVLLRSFISAPQRTYQGVMLAAVTLTICLTIVTNAILPTLYHDYQFTSVGPLFGYILIAGTGYATLRHGLFDIKLAAVRSAAYGLSIVTLAAVYYLIAYFVSVVMFQGEVSSSISVSPINVLLSLILVFIFQPVKNFFDKATDKIFFRDRYTTDDFYARINEVLASTTDLRGLLRRVAAEIGSTLKVDQAFFFVRHEHSRYVSAGTPKHALLGPPEVDILDAYTRSHGEEITITSLLPREDIAVHRLLDHHRVAIVVPLVHKNDIIGYLLLGDQRSGGYTNRDIRTLNNVTGELIIAIQHALSVQEVKDLNTHLQQRIDAATRELKASNTRLRHLDATKDEFLSMASHQLRTPLTSVKGYISMVLEGDAGKITDTQRQLLGEAFTSSERMVHLIHDFLNVSRLQTGKFTLERIPTDIVKLVRDEVASLKLIAESRSTQLVLHVSGDFPLLSIDAGKLRQVVMNYIDNALYYSQDTAKPITVMLTRVDNAVELRVVDNGMGVPKEEQAHLFGKFFRATNARKQRPDGTGVGLYLAKKVITEHGGDIIFLSEEGKGSTFGFRLPIDSLLATKHESQ